MIQVDLITGFLGAGKTTFLLRYARYLMTRGLKIGILVYDHGAVNVDLPLLKELRGENCELEMLAGGCDPDCHKRRFRTKLIAMGMSGYDRIVIEPSGVFDMDEFFDTLNEAPLDRWYEAGSVITVVDALLDERTGEEEDFFLASQAVSAGCVLLSRIQCVNGEAVDRTLRHLERACGYIRADRIPAERIMKKDWSSFTDEDYRKLMNSGYRVPHYVKTIAGEATDFQSLSYLGLPQGGESLRKQAEELLHHLDSVAHRRAGSVRTVVPGSVAAQTSRESYPGKGLGHRNTDVRISLIIREHSVVFGTMFLDQVAFEDQRFGLGIGHDVLEPRDLRDHLFDLRRALISGLKILSDPVFEHDGLAHVDDAVLRVMHEVYARAVWQLFKFFGYVEHGTPF